MIDQVPTHGHRLPRETNRVFVGRSHELAILSDRLSRAQSGSGSVILIAGEAGAGKTTLLGEFLAEAERRGATALSARCWPPSTGTPSLQLWRGIFRDGPRSSERFDVDGPFHAFAEVLSEVERQAGVAVIAVDDVQWADRDSLAVLEALANRIEKLPVMIVAAYRRPHGGSDSPLAATLGMLRPFRGCAQLELHPLDTEEVFDLVEGLAPGIGNTELATRLRQRTEGNLLLLHAVLEESFAADGRTRVDGWRNSKSSVPTGVTEVVARWTSVLAVETQSVLKVAAVAGREFDAQVIEEAMPIGGDCLDAALDEAELAGIVSASGVHGHYRFAHSLVRDALYAGQPARRRGKLHERIALAIEGRSGTARRTSVSAQLAHHYREAGATGAALEHAHAAATEAEGRSAWREAIEFHELALALAAETGAQSKREEATLLTALGKCYRIEGEYRRAWRFFMQAMDLFREAAEGAGLAQVILEALRIPAPPNRRQELVQHALAALDASPSAEMEAQVLLQQTVWMPRENDKERSQRAAEIAERRDGPDIRPILAHAEGSRALRDGRPADARRVFLQLHEMSAAQGRAGWALQLLATANSIPLFEGSLAEGAAGTTRVIGSAKRAGNRLHASGLLTWLAGTAMAQGRGDECSRLLHEAELANPSHFGVAWLRAVRAEIAGDMAAAVALMPDPQTLGRQPAWLAIVHGARARIQFHAGNYDDARRELAQWEHYWAGLAGDNSDDPTASFLHTMASGDAALAALANEDVAGRVYDELARWSWARFAPANGCSLDWLRGALALRLGEEEAAGQHFATGAAWAESEGCCVELGRCLTGAAETAAQSGRHDEALDLLARAREHLQAREANLYVRSVDAAVNATLAARQSASPARRPTVAGLSKRELEVLELIAEGSTNADIAAALGISVNTVARHVTHILVKTGAVNRAEAASFGHRNDLIGRH